MTLLPKSTPFERIDEQDLQAIVNEINGRPMRLLGYRTPAEA